MRIFKIFDELGSDLYDWVDENWGCVIAVALAFTLGMALGADIAWTETAAVLEEIKEMIT